MDNANSREYLEKILVQVLDNLKRTAHAPSVQMTDVPRESLGINDDDEAALDDLDEEQTGDIRMSQRRADKYVEKSGELSDSDEEVVEDSNGRPTSRKRRIMQNYRHITDLGNDSGLDTGSGVDTPQQDSSLPGDEMNVDEDLNAEIRQILGGSTAAANGSAVTSKPHSPAAVATADGDIEMGEADAEPATTTSPHAADEESTITVQPQTAQQHTPPESPSVHQAEYNAANGDKSASTTTKEEGAGEDIPTSAPPASSGNQTDAPGAPLDETAVKQEVVGDDEVAKAQEEGRLEREAANAEGEARTEAASRAEIDDEPEAEL